MELKQLRCFIAAVDQGSFSRAAKQLYVTQSAVSQQIAALERQVGARLFERTGRSVRLTDSGRFLYQRVRPSIEQIDDAVDKAASAPTTEVPHLTMYYRGGAVDPIVVPLLAHLHEKTPVCHVDLLRSHRTQDVLVSLSLREADVALLKRRPHPLTKSMVFHPLCLVYLACALPSDHPLASQPVIGPEDLEHERLVLLESRGEIAPGTPYADAPDSDMRYQREHDELRRRFGDHSTLTVDFVTAITLAKAGFGITLVDSSQATSTERLAFIPYRKNRWFEYGVFASAYQTNPLVETLLATADELFADRPVFEPGGNLVPLDRFLAAHPGIVLNPGAPPDESTA